MIDPKETSPSNNITPLIGFGSKVQFTATTGTIEGVVVAIANGMHASREIRVYAIVDTLGGFHYATQECVSPITKKPQKRTTAPKHDATPRKSPNPKTRNIDFEDLYESIAADNAPILAWSQIESIANDYRLKPSIEERVAPTGDGTMRYYLTITTQHKPWRYKQFGRIELVQQKSERWLREQVEERCRAFLVLNPRVKQEESKSV